MRSRMFEMEGKKTAPNLKTFSTIDHKAYVWYKQRSEHNNRRDVKDFVEYGKILTEFYRIAEKHLADNLGGIYIDKLGYFGVCKHVETPSKRIAYLREHMGKYNTDGDVYYLSFVPISYTTIERTYSMDLAFTKIMKTRLTENLRNGYAYMFNPSLFYYNNKKKRHR